ncbi:MAG: alkaline phosphatase family protein [Gemmatimonadota bacterium]
MCGLAGQRGSGNRSRGGGLSRPPQDRPGRVLLIFVDGVGIGPGDEGINPLAAADLPTLDAVLRGARPIAEDIPPRGLEAPGVRLTGIDANLGVEGRPQSGTGQTALLTGTNAPKILGRHFGPWVPTALRDLLLQRNLFRTAAEAGHTVAFANAYPSGFLEPGGRGARWPGAMPLAAHLAGVLVRNERSVRESDGLVSSITTERWRRHVDPRAPDLTPPLAGEILARIAGRYRLTVFAHFDTDHVGHEGDLAEGVAAIERVDAFLGGVLAQMSDDLLVLLTSDHGNLEDTTLGHTRNPVPLLAIGPGADSLSERVRSTADVAPFILGLLAE